MNFGNYAAPHLWMVLADFRKLRFKLIISYLCVDLFDQ